jgi:hydroxymethylbilane synthase
MQENITLRIGAGKRKSEMMMAKKMSDDLAICGISSSISHYESIDPSKNIQEVLYDAIRANEIDTAAFDLSVLPVYDSHHDIVVTAISERRNPGEGLLISSTAYDPSSELKIKSGARVMVSDVRQGGQLLSMLPTISLTYNPEHTEDQLSKLTNGQCDVLLMSKNDYETLIDNDSDFTFLKLHPKEMIPRPGQGFTAYLAHKDDLKTRRILKNIHRADAVQMSNVERKVLQMLPPEYLDKTGVYCHTDQRGYFHVDAVRCDVYQKITFSQSISADLAEKIYFSIFTP